MALIYLDNAATTYPKPAPVLSTLSHAARRFGGNPGRSGHTLALSTLDAVYRVREKIAVFFDAPDPTRVVFFENATYALNTAIKCHITSPCHVLISDMEHNATLRPIEALKERLGITYDTFHVAAKDLTAEIESKRRPDTKFIVSTLASNVTGERVDPKILSSFRRKYGIRLILDASQAAGHDMISLSETPADVLCAPGHKGLFGVTGSGFAIFAGGEDLPTLIEGGSGFASASPIMPKELPDRFEAGTLPVPAILSLGAGIEWINDTGLAAIREKTATFEEHLTEFIGGVRGLRVTGHGGGIISFTSDLLPPEIFARALDDRGVAVRAGLHCAPLSHKTLGTFPAGTVRISLSPLNTEKEILAAERAIRAVAP